MTEAIGTVRACRSTGGGVRLSVAAPFAKELAQGESVAVDGACLTVVAIGAGGFEADVSGETLARTTLGAVRPGGRVNLERALKVGDRLGGHIVSGHVDGRGRITSRTPRGEYLDVQVEADEKLPGAIVAKGSVAVDGISLTVSGLGQGRFSVTLIPETIGATTLAAKDVGAAVNIETDIIGKYVQEYLGAEARDAGQAEGAVRPLQDLFSARITEGG